MFLITNQKKNSKFNDHLICEWTIASLENICRDYNSRIERLEDEKYDFEYIVKGKDYQVHIKIAKAAETPTQTFF